MKRLGAAIATLLLLTGCTPASIPTVETITSADLGPLKLVKEVKGYCYPTELFCGNPLFEPTFTAPADADPGEVCDKVIAANAKAVADYKGGWSPGAWHEVDDARPIVVGEHRGGKIQGDSDIDAFDLERLRTVSPASAARSRA